MKIRIKVFLCFIIIYISSNIYGQKILLESKISVSIIDKSLIEAIEIVSNASAINFSYNAELIPENVKVRCKFNNEKVSDVLTLLLKRYNIGYKEIKNQIILYKLPLTNKEYKEIKHYDTYINNIQIPNELGYDDITGEYTDTLLIIFKDTLKEVVIDTVTNYYYDTAIVYDTMIIKKVKTEKIPAKNRYSHRKSHFAVELATSVGYNNFALYSESNDSLFNEMNTLLNTSSGYSFGFRLYYSHLNFIVQTGLELNNYQQRFNISTIENNTYLKIDTIEKYIAEEIGNDTSWVYITEKNIVEREIHMNMKSIFDYKYLQIPIIVGFKFNKKPIKYELKVGLIPEIYLNKKGFNFSKIDTIGNEVVKSLQSPLKKNNLSLYLALGINIPVTKKANVIFEPFIFQQLSSMYEDNWVEQKFIVPGLKFNIRYIFF